MTSDSMKALLEAWGQIPTSGGPLVLPGDRPALERAAKYTVHHASFAAYCADPYFGLDDTRLHTGLVPLPFLGNLETADIFLLMLNPGLSPGDYFAEERFADYRADLLSNLKQVGVAGFPFLDPALSWHPGGQYWLGRFHDVAVALSESCGSFQDALQLLAQHVACLELVPYHSPRFGLPGRVVENLESVKLIQRYVREDLGPRAAKGEILLIVTRQVARWALMPSENVILYGNAHARGGHISRAAPGGSAILRFLSR